jgi:hypothetical protein
MGYKYCEVKTVYGKQALTGYECIIGYDIVSKEGEVVGRQTNYDQADYDAGRYERKREFEAGERVWAKGFEGVATVKVTV